MEKEKEVCGLKERGRWEMLANILSAFMAVFTPPPPAFPLWWGGASFRESLSVEACFSRDVSVCVYVDVGHEQEWRIISHLE